MDVILKYFILTSFYVEYLQEKQKGKVREKLDKHTKEKLLEFCDLLDIPVSRATTRKVCLILLLPTLELFFS